MENLNLKQQLLLFLLILCGSAHLESQQDLQMGYDFLEQQEYSKACLFFGAALNQQPDNRTAAICYNRALGLGGEVETALNNFEALRSEFPMDLEIQYNIAEALMWNKEFRLAMKLYADLLVLEPDSFLAHYGYANANAALSETAEALKHINTALVIQPGNMQAITAKKSILLAATFRQYSKGKLSRTKPFLSELALLSPGNAKYLDLKALIRRQGASIFSLGCNHIWDNGGNEAAEIFAHFKSYLVDRHTISVQGSRVSIFNKRTGSEAIEHSFFMRDFIHISSRHRLSLGIKAYNSKVGDSFYSGLLQNHSVEGHWSASLFTSLTFQERLMNYSVDQLESAIIQNDLSLVANYLITKKIGLYMNGVISKVTDGNEKRTLNASLYFAPLDNSMIKVGLNCSRFTFRMEAQDYFSPQEFNSMEVFCIWGNSHKNKALDYSVTLGAGGQQSGPFSPPTISCRTKVKIGYSLSSGWNFNGAFTLGNTASAESLSDYARYTVSVQVGYTLKYSVSAAEKPMIATKHPNI